MILKGLKQSSRGGAVSTRTCGLEGGLWLWERPWSKTQDRSAESQNKSLGHWKPRGPEAAGDKRKYRAWRRSFTALLRSLAIIVFVQGFSTSSPTGEQPKTFALESLQVTVWRGRRQMSRWGGRASGFWPPGPGQWSQEWIGVDHKGLHCGKYRKQVRWKRVSMASWSSRSWNIKSSTACLWRQNKRATKGSPQEIRVGWWEGRQKM